MTNSIKNLEGVTPMTTQETKETKGGFFFLLSHLFGGYGKSKGGEYGGGSSYGGRGGGSYGGNNCGCSCGH